MSDFSDSYGDTGYVDGSYSSSVDTAVADGTLTDHGTSADYTADSSAATDVSWDAWGASLHADSNATEAWYAGDTDASTYWSTVSDGYEADSWSADAAADTAWDASSTADADESAAWDAGVADTTDYSYDGYEADDSVDAFDWSGGTDLDDGSADYGATYDSATTSYDTTATGYESATSYDSGYDY